MRQIVKMGEPTHFGQWKQDFLTCTGRRARYEDLLQEHRSEKEKDPNATTEYGRLKKELRREQGEICCYCEKRLGAGGASSSIEHYMPRHPDERTMSVEEANRCKDADMDYGNMGASCEDVAEFPMPEEKDHCNHKKANWFDFHAWISPTEPAIKRAFRYGIDGRVRAVNSAQNDMLKHLNLNTEALVQQRKAALDEVMEQEFYSQVNAEELLEDREYILATIESYRTLGEDGKYCEFCSMICDGLQWHAEG